MNKAKRYVLPVMAGALAFGGVALATNNHEQPKEKLYACHQTDKGWKVIHTEVVVAPDFLYKGDTRWGKPSDKNWCEKNEPVPEVTPPVVETPAAPTPVAEPAPTVLPETGAQG